MTYRIGNRYYEHYIPSQKEMDELYLDYNDKMQIE
jgi:hypothetical protein